MLPIKPLWKTETKNNSRNVNSMLIRMNWKYPYLSHYNSPHCWPDLFLSNRALVTIIRPCTGVPFQGPKTGSSGCFSVDYNEVGQLYWKRMWKLCHVPTINESPVNRCMHFLAEKNDKTELVATWIHLTSMPWFWGLLFWSYFYHSVMNVLW